MVIGVKLMPESIVVVQGDTAPRLFCAFIRMASGRIVNAAGAPCAGYYATLPLLVRTGVTPVEQATADSVCVRWSTTDLNVVALQADQCAIGLRQGLIVDVAFR
jgi:hypothetical protein